MKTFIFPGQGSQVKGMGGGLFDEFSELTQQADEILGYSIKELCLENPKRKLNKTQYTQPALYVVNALSFYKKLKDTNVKPDYVAGHSLGEFNALLAAECFDFETGLTLVKKRGELMAGAPEGGMAAILNATKEQIESILSENNLNQIDIANYNTPAQIVISGDIEEIGKAQDLFQHDNMMYYPLNTSGAFHSRFMQPASEQFKAFLNEFTFSPLKIPVISNVTARPYEDKDVVDNLAAQLASSVRWCGSIQYLMWLDENGQKMEFEEVGNGDVLSKMLHFIEKETTKSVESLTVKTEKSDELPVSASATELVEKWNKQYPVGTAVRSLTHDYDKLETRSEAMVLFGHRAAVYMQGYNGYFDLTELAPANA
ncbi:ACP S-malonyltransferase [Teredinibacter haidensis]|uniref:ACP S-malonyltransferase n=1 Tax=Teredinibacter haidensis TaxID=2731755 RepID=UPI000ADDD0DA|nr:ACP S-malonyltransferase [Teredinibacter haidensis]